MPAATSRASPSTRARSRRTMLWTHCSSANSARPCSVSLAIVLDHVLAADVGALRVGAGRAQCASLAQEVPELVEPHLRGAQLALLLVGQPAPLGVTSQLVLAGDERLDAVFDRLVRIGHGPVNLLTNSRAVSATSRQPLSMVSAWPRPGISVISVTPSLCACFLYCALATAHGIVWSFSPLMISTGPRSGFLVSTLASVHGLRFAAAAWKI